ncbi:MAG: adenylate/guanylate cyclase domain-containing protein [Acidimicrobiia bacterium]
MAGWRTETVETLELRVGLASGSVIGGVIGQRRMLFDVWGETVNTASRMESSGLPEPHPSGPLHHGARGRPVSVHGARSRCQRDGADDDLSPRRLAGLAPHPASPMTSGRAAS